MRFVRPRRDVPVENDQAATPGTRVDRFPGACPPASAQPFGDWFAGSLCVDQAGQPLMVFRGARVGEGLIGGTDPVGGTDRPLEVLWASSSRSQALFFADNELQHLYLAFRRPLVITEVTHETGSHASIVRRALHEVQRGHADWDCVVFPDTVDGMEVGDVFAVLPRGGDVNLGVAHAARLVGSVVYSPDDGAPTFHGAQPLASRPDRVWWNSLFSLNEAETDLDPKPGAA